MTDLVEPIWRGETKAGTRLCLSVDKDGAHWLSVAMYNGTHHLVVFADDMLRLAVAVARQEGYELIPSRVVNRD